MVTERLRILIHVSDYFQTLEIMEKTLSDKNEPYVRTRGKQKKRLADKKRKGRKTKQSKK